MYESYLPRTLVYERSGLISWANEKWMPQAPHTCLGFSSNISPQNQANFNYVLIHALLYFFAYRSVPGSL